MAVERYVLAMPEPRAVRPFAEHHEEWSAHLRRHVVSRRTLFKGAITSVTAAALLGERAWSEPALASASTGLGTVAGGFLVNGRHLSFGDDATTEMWVGGQLFNINHYNAVPPGSIRVWLDYGRSVEADIRELLTHVPVWNGQPGVLKASRTLNADQFFVHAHLTGLDPGQTYHYRFRYMAGREVGTTPDATLRTAPANSYEPFTFTAFGDEGIPGPSLDRNPSLLPESDWGMWNDGSYSPNDPDNPKVTGT